MNPRVREPHPKVAAYRRPIPPGRFAGASARVLAAAAAPSQTACMPTHGQMLPALLIVVATSAFFVLERVRPGRPLPASAGWYARAGLLSLAQLALIGLGGVTWNAYFRDHSLLALGGWRYPALEGAFYWFAGTFVFYWWHRLRHASGFWRVFHQVHHSPARIEALTAFYKHPLEIAADAVLTGFFIYFVCGGTAEAGAWTSLYGAVGVCFYHSNIRTPAWVGLVLQRPEHHSIHHQLGVHAYNYGDITWWDRLFGTFKDTDRFADRCGFPGQHELRLGEMLRFVDVHPADHGTPAPAGALTFRGSARRRACGPCACRMARCTSPSSRSRASTNWTRSSPWAC